jgi:hypothetical protein
MILRGGNSQPFICSGVDAHGFFVIRDIVSDKLIREFQDVVRNDISEKESDPLFVIAFHEDDDVPENLNTLKPKMQDKIMESFRSRSVEVTFEGSSKIQIQVHSKKLNLHLDLKEEMAYDENRRALRAFTNTKLNAVCKKVHQCVQSSLTKTYSRCSRYRRYRRYSQKIGSIILTRKGSVRQPFHTDTDLIEGNSALVAMNGAFKLIILKNSVRLLRRIAQIRAQWILSGSQIPPDQIEMQSRNGLTIPATPSLCAKVGVLRINLKHVLSMFQRRQPSFSAPGYYTVGMNMSMRISRFSIDSISICFRLKFKRDSPPSECIEPKWNRAG